MRDLPKLVIVGSTAVLVLGAVLLMLFMTGGKEPPQKETEQGGHEEQAAVSPPPAVIEAGGTPASPAGQLPDTLQLPASLKLPCAATLQEIAAKYYNSITLHDGSAVQIPAAAHADIARRLAKHNGGIDPAAALPAGATVILPRIYIVGRSDTLTKISSKIYGTTARWRDINNLNADIIKNPDTITLGWALILP